MHLLAVRVITLDYHNAWVRDPEKSSLATSLGREMEVGQRYSRLFDWLVWRINQSTASKDTGKKDLNKIFEQQIYWRLMLVFHSGCHEEDWHIGHLWFRSFRLEFIWVPWRNQIKVFKQIMSDCLWLACHVLAQGSFASTLPTRSCSSISILTWSFGSIQFFSFLCQSFLVMLFVLFFFPTVKFQDSHHSNFWMKELAFAEWMEWGLPWNNVYIQRRASLGVILSGRSSCIHLMTITADLMPRVP